MGCCASSSASETRRQLRCFRCHNPLGPRIPAGWFVCLHCSSSTTPVVRTTSGGHYRVVAERQMDLLPLNRSGREVCRYCSVILPALGGASCPSCVAGPRAPPERRQSPHSGRGAENGGRGRPRLEARIAPSPGRERPCARNFALEQSIEALDALALRLGIALSALDGPKSDTTSESDSGSVLRGVLDCAINDSIDSVSCPVCLEVMCAPMLLQCGHSLCSKHMDHLRNGACPVCRARFMPGRCNDELRQTIKAVQLLARLEEDPDKGAAVREVLSVADIPRQQ